MWRGLILFVQVLGQAASSWSSLPLRNHRTVEISKARQCGWTPSVRLVGFDGMSVPQSPGQINVVPE
jgi:hypothetical protein